MDYKNADKKALKENLKNNIHKLLTESNHQINEDFDEGVLGNFGQKVKNAATGFVQGYKQSKVLSNIEKIDASQYSDAVKILQNVVASSNQNNNQAFREALLKEFEQLGGDKITVDTNASVPVSQLMPTQNIIAADGSLGYFLYEHQDQVVTSVNNAFTDNVKVAGSPIITCGNYIVDGHHRWSQIYLLNPNAKMAAIDLGKGFSDKSQVLKLVQIAIANAQIAAGQKQLPVSHAEGGINLLGNPGGAKQALIEYVQKSPVFSTFVIEMYKHIGGQLNEGFFQNIGQGIKNAVSSFNKPVQQEPQVQQGTPAQPAQQPQAPQEQQNAVLEYCGNNAASLSQRGSVSDPDRSLMPQTDKTAGKVDGAVGSISSLSQAAKGDTGGQTPAQQDSSMQYKKQAYEKPSSALMSNGDSANVGNTGNKPSNVSKPVSVPPQYKNNQQQVAENKKNNNMRLTESQLRQIVRESAKKVLSEINKEYEDMHKAKAYDDYLGQNMFKRGWDIVTGKRPEKPNPYTPNEPMSTRAQRYVDAFNKSHSLGNRVDYDNGESYNSRMNWSDDPDNRYEPVLTQTTFDGSTVAQQRKAYDEAGNEKEWGIEYPYSEMGYTGEYEGDNDDIKRRSADFKKLRGEVSGKLAASKKERDKKSSGKSKKNESVVRMTQGDFQKFITESVKNVISEMTRDGGFEDFQGGMDKNWADRIGRRYAEKAKYGYGNLDEGPWEDDGEFERERARVKGASRRRNFEDMNEMDEYEASWDTLEKNPDYNPGGMGPAYQKYGIPDDVLYGDR